MLNYTDAITRLMHDIVERVPSLSFIDVSQVLVFARFGRSTARGPYATCHSLNLPASEPRYFFWADPRTRRVTRRSEWFVTRSPAVSIDGRSVRYLISVVLPRFCDQALIGSHKHAWYRGEPWLAKLDTVIHELYHIDPADAGIRLVNRRDADVVRSHSPEFFAQVTGFVRRYLASRPDAATYEFLSYDFASLRQRYGDIVARTFRQFPSYPQRYHDPLAAQPAAPDSEVPVVPLDEPRRPRQFTAADLALRTFTERGTRPWAAGASAAAVRSSLDQGEAGPATQPAGGTTRRAPTNRGGQ
jgi:hypothetical protein